MVVNRWLLILAFTAFAAAKASGQCGDLLSDYDLSFSTDQVCAPVTVNNFTITYKFLAPQDPNSIAIVFEWNNTGNDATIVDLASGDLVVSSSVHGPNTVFSASATFTYHDNDNECIIQPTVSVFINNNQCTSSITNTPPAFFWDNDEGGNGEVVMSPLIWDVCFGNPVINARFNDASEFNCNINIEPDHPNERARHVQFVYGTNLAATPTIRDLSLNDGATNVGLTDALGNFLNTESRGTPGRVVTGSFFGDIETVPFPANAPISVSLPMNAPANLQNIVGTRFEVTMFNWNFCNPWNGDEDNPNYEDAIMTRAYIEIVDGPDAAFDVQDEFGNPKLDFCIGDMIHLDNRSINANAYRWEFYDSDTDAGSPIHTSTAAEPTFSYSSGGRKLIRLIAENSTAQNSCLDQVDMVVNITPALVARIGITDLNDVPITPDFCQESAAPFSTFDVRFNDISSGIPTATTRWRWEFYDEHDNLIFDAPAGNNNFSSAVLGPFDRVFSNRGIHRVRLRIKDNVTGCETVDEVLVRVFEKPQPQFTVNRACEGAPTMFEDNSTLNPIAGEQIVSWEWDLNYDGTTFTKDPALDNQRSFQFTYAAPGTYQAALRVTTNTGTCSAVLSQTVEVDPLPTASFTPDITSGCSALDVAFTNHAAGQADLVKEFVWEVDAGSGFEIDSVQRPGDPGFSDVFVKTFKNTGTANRDYRIRLRVVTVNDCEVTSAPSTITVFPQPRSGFVALNYSPFNDNCTPISVDFRVDNSTQALHPTDYTWRIDDSNGLVDEISTGTTPNFAYNFVNTTPFVKDFFVTLRATLPSMCYGDSTRTIRIAPVPSSEFAVDTVTYACDRVLLALNAAQRGLSEYEWTITINNVVVFSSSLEGDHLEYEIARSSTTDQDVTLSLATTNLTNCESTVTTKHIFVARTENMNASFTASPVEQTLPASTVTIVNTSNAGPWDYFWDFGDGTTSTEKFVSSHTYETFGVYTITLKVSNNDCVQTVSRDVKINPIPPVLQFDYFPPTGCAPHAVTFVNESKYADPTTYFWRFGAGEGTSRAVDPTYTYQRPGRYSVTLSATNLLGDTVTLTKELIIDVRENPVARFAIYPTTPLNIPGEILYTDNRSQHATEYLWDFGDGNTSTDPEPQHQYKEEGKFTITLIARNGDGCADTTVLESAVTTVKHGQLLVPNAFIPNPTGPGSTNILNNEVFLPLVQNVTKFQMLIFNRWGELMFESTSPDVGWDGYHQGRLCAQDVYIYRITAEYDNGRTITRTGDINLLR